MRKTTDTLAIMAAVGIAIYALSKWRKGELPPSNGEPAPDGEPIPTDLTVEEITVILPWVYLGNEVAILAEISRPVATEGFVTHTIPCEIDGEILYSELIFFPGEIIGNVWFNYTPAVKGKYTVTVLGETATFDCI